MSYLPPKGTLSCVITTALKLERIITSKKWGTLPQCHHDGKEAELCPPRQQVILAPPASGDPCGLGSL